MKATKSHHELRFSMKALLAGITASCVVLAIPGGYILLTVGALWGVLGAAWVAVLMLFKAKIYRILSGLTTTDNELV